LGQGFQIGHSFLCFADKIQNKEELDKKLKEVVDYEIMPLISEYWFDDKNKINEFKIEFDRIFS